MSLGVARARGSSCTITSYCLLLRVKVLVLLPPSRTWSVVATSATGTPRSSARSRSKVTVSWGLLTRRSLSTLISPATWRARASRVSLPRARESKLGCWITKFTGFPNPNAGGLLAKAKIPGMAKNWGCTSLMISCTERVRVDQSSRLVKIIPRLTPSPRLTTLK